MSYDPRDPPASKELSDIVLWVREELKQIRDHINQDYGAIWVKSGTTVNALTTTASKILFADSEIGTGDFANNRIYIHKNGTYLLSFQISLDGTASIEYSFELAVNGALQGILGAQDGGAFNSIGVVPTPLELSEGDEVTIYGYVDSSANATVKHGQLTCLRIGD